MFERLKISGLLSFPAEVDLELRPLNVIIGPNGSGKSNLIDSFFLLSKTSGGFQEAVGRVSESWEWSWKGNERLEAEIISVIKKHSTLRYEYNLYFQDMVVFETLVERKGTTANGGQKVLDSSALRVLRRSGATPGSKRIIQELDSKKYDFSKPILGQIQDPQIYPEIFFVSQFFSKIQFYRDWNFGKKASPRRPQPADEFNSFLYEDASNLALVLNFLDRDGTLKRVESELARFFERAERISVQIAGGMAQLFLREKGIEKLIPATRLSDGTIRYLCLLAILLHPEPPPVICMEEPELGLHPDMIRRVAELMKEASQRTQLIVTTHSTELVDALSDDPESVVVCERSPEHGGSEFRRLDGKALAEWLKDYSLGQLWRKGEIGGNRF